MKTRAGTTTRAPPSANGARRYRSRWRSSSRNLPSAPARAPNAAGCSASFHGDVPPRHAATPRRRIQPGRTTRKPPATAARTAATSPMHSISSAGTTTSAIAGSGWQRTTPITSIWPTTTATPAISVAAGAILMRSNRSPAGSISARSTTRASLPAAKIASSAGAGISSGRSAADEQRPGPSPPRAASRRAHRPGTARQIRRSSARR